MMGLGLARFGMEALDNLAPLEKSSADSILEGTMPTAGPAGAPGVVLQCSKEPGNLQKIKRSNNSIVTHSVSVSRNWVLLHGRSPTLRNLESKLRPTMRLVWLWEALNLSELNGEGTKGFVGQPKIENKVATLTQTAWTKCSAMSAQAMSWTCIQCGGGSCSPSSPNAPLFALSESAGTNSETSTGAGGGASQVEWWKETFGHRHNLVTGRPKELGQLSPS